MKKFRVYQRYMLRPLIYLTIAGVVNVILNLITVIIFHMNVAGVAIATVASQAVSAVLAAMEEKL